MPIPNGIGIVVDSHGMSMEHLVGEEDPINSSK